MGLSESLEPLGTLEAIYELLGDNQQYDMFLSQTINNTMAASLIDRIVTCQGDTVSLPSSGDVDLHYELGAEAQTVVAKIFDAQGQLVRILSDGTTSSGAQKFVWDGKNSEGERLAAGPYSVQIIAADASGNQVSAAAVLRGKVEGVKYVDGQAYLNVNGSLVPLADIREISAA
jgi:flagellar basal-body rod modification protein FlgD